MVNRLAQKYPWLPFYVLVGAMMAAFAVSAYFVWLDPVPYREVYAFPTVHDGSVPTRFGLTALESIAPGELMYTYREYCLSSTQSRLYLRRWLQGTDAHNRDVLYAYELQLVVPQAGERGCHTLSLALEAPSIKAGHYLLYTQAIMHTNVFRQDLVTLTPISVFISGMTVAQRIVKQESDIDRLQRFDLRFERWMSTIEHRLTLLRGELALHRKAPNGK